ncbi:hypothetical protein M0802_007185 [Mischocyttarus mexicanus]|nr:hypothetical protein M0802_007185 [Mischocyttarus mexicanus]
MLYWRTVYTNVEVKVPTTTTFITTTTVTRREDRFLSDCEISGVLLFALLPSPRQSCSMSATKYFPILRGGS